MDTTIASPLLIDQNLPLDKLLRSASAADLAALADIITDTGRGRVSLTDATKKIILQKKRQNSLYTIAPVLSAEICAFGGNTIINVFRQKKSPAYNVVALDVAKRLGAKVGKAAEIVEIEREIIKKILTKSLKKIKEDEVGTLLDTNKLNVDREKINRLLRQGKTEDAVSLLIHSCDPYAVSRMLNVSLLTALNMVVKVGLPVFGKAIASRAPALLNPVAAVISTACMTYELSGPAYRITVPAVIRIASIRLANIQLQTDQFRSELTKCL